jgi:exonuclease SbcD
VEVVFDYTPGVNINEALASVLEGAPFEVVSKKANRADALTADSFSDDTLDSVEGFSDEEIFKLLIMSRAGAREMNDSIQKDYERFRDLFMKVVEEVKNENQ